MSIGNYHWLMRVRPEFLAAALKKLLRVKRQIIQGPANAVFWADPVTILGMDLQQSGVYEPEMTRLVTGLLRSHDTFIDVGANEGYFSVLAALVANQGRVLSIEPQEAMQQVIAENFRLNAIRHAEVENIALSDIAGETVLYLRTSINQGASRIDVPHKGMGLKATVRTATLAELLASKNIDHARVIKIDCEGAEFKILKGSPKLFRNQIFDFILLEYHFNVLTNEQGMQLHQLLTTSAYGLAKWHGQTIYYRQELAGDLAAIDAGIQMAADF